MPLPARVRQGGRGMTVPRILMNVDSLAVRTAPPALTHPEATRVPAMNSTLESTVKHLNSVSVSIVSEQPKSWARDS